MSAEQTAQQVQDSLDAFVLSLDGPEQTESKSEPEAKSEAQIIAEQLVANALAHRYLDNEFYQQNCAQIAQEENGRKTKIENIKKQTARNQLLQ